MNILTPLPSRIQKAVYSKDWKDGKPQNRNTGISQIIKYFSAESYEDTLSNILLSEDANHRGLNFGNDYLIRYMLETESKNCLLDINKFKTPFNYSLKIAEKNEIKEHPIDMAETFNYLLGIRGKRFYYDVSAKDFRAVKGVLPDESRALIIWRTQTDNSKKDNAALTQYMNETLRPLVDYTKIDHVYINGDNSLAKVRKDGENYTVHLTEDVFSQKMFEETGGLTYG